MQYKFNRQYLQSLLVDSQKKYNEGILSRSDYKLLNQIIKELMFGNKTNDKKMKLNKLDTINFKLNILKNELGMETIENLLYLSDYIVRNSSYIKLNDDYYKQTSSELVDNVLNFYKDCDEKYYNYLNEISHNSISQLEIVTGNNVNKEIFETSVQILPFYDLDYIRVVRENRLYDEATLCHEFRHALDIREVSNNSLDFNVFSETNSIAMELYYEMLKKDSNPGYKVGIDSRLNHLRQMAIYVKMYMELLLDIDNYNCLTKKMVEETFNVHSKEKLHSTLLDLDHDSGYRYVAYFVGILKGMYLCNVAQENPKQSFKLQDRLCSVMVGNYFVPRSLEDVMGKDFILGEVDIETYKSFIKKLN